MKPWCVAVTLLAACGRFSFDATNAAEDAMTDASPPRTADFDVDFTAGTLGSFTFTRASSASYVGADRRIHYAGVDEPRFDHHPATGEPRGLLVEGTSVNMAFYSEQLDAGGDWFTNESVGGSVTITPDVELAPDGSMTADRVTETDSANVNRRAQIVAIPNDTSDYVCSMFLKAGTSPRRTFSCELLNGTNIQVDLTVDLTSGTILDIEDEAEAHGLDEYPDGWWRAWITLRNNASGNDVAIVSVVSYRPDTSVNGSVYAWGAQVEAGSGPTSYIPSPTNTSVMRAPDFAGTTELGWLDPERGSLLVAGELEVLHQRDQHAVCFVNADPAYTCISRYGATGTSALLYQGTPIVEGSAWTGEPSAVLFARDLPNLTLYDPGAAATVTSPLARVPTVELVLGRDTTRWFDGWIRRVAYWQSSLTSEERTTLGVQ